MKVRCIGRSIGDIPVGYSDARTRLREGPFPLTVGKVYLVYAIETPSATVQYYLHDDEDLPYPVWYAAPLFELVDPLPSRYWICAYHPPADLAGGFFVLSFPDWATNRYFYDDLVAGKSEAVLAYSKYRRLMETEGEGESKS